MSTKRAWDPAVLAGDIDIRIHTRVLTFAALIALSLAELDDGCLYFCDDGNMWQYQVQSIDPHDGVAAAAPTAVSSSSAYTTDPTSAPGRFINSRCGSTSKFPVKAKATGNIAATRSGNVLTVTATGALGNIDGIACGIGDRVDLFAQTTAADRGLYVCINAGATGVHPKFMRAADFSTSARVKSGATWFVSQGNTTAGISYVLSTPDPITLNSTSLTSAVQASASGGQTVNGITVYAVAPFKAISLSNVASLSGTATVDGVACGANDRVCLMAQTTQSQNGPWVVQSGAWTRPTDWTSGSTPPLGTEIKVAPGGNSFAQYGGTWYLDSNGTGGVVDTDNFVFYPRKVKGHGGLSSASPSTLAVSNLWVKTGAEVSVTNQTTAANGLKATVTAGAGTGSLAVTGPNTVTDTVSYVITNA